MEENVKKGKKSKVILILIGIVIYTLLVIYLTVDVYKGILEKRINDAFNETFNEDTLFENQDEENEDNIIINSNDKEDDDISISNKEDNEEASKATKLNFNDTVTKEGKYELTVTGYNIAKKILPPNTSGYYSYYEAKEDGHQYLELKYNYKNLESSGVDADEVATIKIKYADKYEYTGFSVIQDSESDFTYSNITEISPLTVGKLHYLFDIPDEVANGTGSIVATITVGNDVYEITIR